jgi:hypothetical protein
VVYEVTELEIALLEFELGKGVANVGANDDSCGLLCKEVEGEMHGSRGE